MHVGHMESHACDTWHAMYVTHCMPCVSMHGTFEGYIRSYSYNLVRGKKEDKGKKRKGGEGKKKGRKGKEKGRKKEKMKEEKRRKMRKKEKEERERK